MENNNLSNVCMYNNLKPFNGVVRSDKKKVLPNLEEAIKKSGLKSGMTISFHHHFRDGDLVLNKVMEVISKQGLNNLTIVATSLRDHHHQLIEHIKNGVVKKIYTTGLRGNLGEEICQGLMKDPVTIYSHGGRAGAIETGRIRIDVAFVAVSAADQYGNLNGVQGQSICGSLGYIKVDANHAHKVIAITDNLVEFPLDYISIPQSLVDYIVKVDRVGDSTKIATGSLRKTRDPKQLLIAKKTAKIISKLPCFKNNFSIQTGSGGISLSVIKYLKDIMKNRNLIGSFILGGITGDHVELLEEGFFKKIFDTQTFDLRAMESLRRNTNHVEIDASLYASPFNKGPLVNNLDFVVLSGLEIDTNFNVNVITGSDGFFRGASGGHCDTAAGAKVRIVVAPAIRGRIPTIKKKVTTVITPGETIDILVTEQGVCINPGRKDLLKEIKKMKNIDVMDINELKEKIIKLTGRPEPIKFDEQVVGLVEYRDGKIIDVIRKVKE